MKIVRISPADFNYSIYRLAKRMILHDDALLLTKYQNDYVAVVSMEHFRILRNAPESQKQEIIRIPIPSTSKICRPAKLVAVQGKTVIFTKTRGRNDDVFAIISLSDLALLWRDCEKRSL